MTELKRINYRKELLLTIANEFYIEYLVVNEKGDTIFMFKIGAEYFKIIIKRWGSAMFFSHFNYVAGDKKNHSTISIDCSEWAPDSKKIDKINDIIDIIYNIIKYFGEKNESKK